MTFCSLSALRSRVGPALGFMAAVEEHSPSSVRVHPTLATLCGSPRKDNVDMSRRTYGMRPAHSSSRHVTSTREEPGRSILVGPHTLRSVSRHGVHTVLSSEGDQPGRGRQRALGQVSPRHGTSLWGSVAGQQGSGSRTARRPTVMRTVKRTRGEALRRFWAPAPAGGVAPWSEVIRGVRSSLRGGRAGSVARRKLTAQRAGRWIAAVAAARWRRVARADNSAPFAPPSTLMPQRMGRDSPKSAALIH
jgi:hypothetical protein